MPIRAQTRREPQNGKIGFSTIKGFTVIELMIAVGVLAIVASLALPSYRSIIEKRQVTSSAEQFGAFFGSVKGHAVKRNHDIAMYPEKSGNDWCLGFKEFDDSTNYATQKCSCMLTDVANAGSCRVDLNNDGVWQSNELTVLRSTDLRKPEVLTGIKFLKDGTEVTNRFFIFDSVRGFLDVQGDYANSLTMQFESGDYKMETTIDRLGRTFICSSQSATLKVPGYETC